MHCCPIEFRLILAKFRPEKYWNSDQNQTNLDRFYTKFRPKKTRPPDAFTDVLVLYN